MSKFFGRKRNKAKRAASEPALLQEPKKQKKPLFGLFGGRKKKRGKKGAVQGENDEENDLANVNLSEINNGVPDIPDPNQFEPKRRNSLGIPDPSEFETPDPDSDSQPGEEQKQTEIASPQIQPAAETPRQTSSKPSPTEDFDPEKLFLEQLSDPVAEISNDQKKEETTPPMLMDKEPSLADLNKLVINPEPTSPKSAPAAEPKTLEPMLRISDPLKKFTKSVSFRDAPKEKRLSPKNISISKNDPALNKTIKEVIAPELFQVEAQEDAFDPSKLKKEDDIEIDASAAQAKQYEVVEEEIEPVKEEKKEDVVDESPKESEKSEVDVEKAKKDQEDLQDKNQKLYDFLKSVDVDENEDVEDEEEEKQERKTFEFSPEDSDEVFFADEPEIVDEKKEKVDDFDKEKFLQDVRNEVRESFREEIEELKKIERTKSEENEAIMSKMRQEQEKLQNMLKEQSQKRNSLSHDMSLIKETIAEEMRKIERKSSTDESKVTETISKQLQDLKLIENQFKEGTSKLKFLESRLEQAQKRETILFEKLLSERKTEPVQVVQAPPPVAPTPFQPPQIKDDSDEIKRLMKQTEALRKERQAILEEEEQILAFEMRERFKVDNFSPSFRQNEIQSSALQGIFPSEQTMFQSKSLFDISSVYNLLEYKYFSPHFADGFSFLLKLLTVVFVMSVVSSSISMFSFISNLGIQAQNSTQTEDLGWTPSLKDGTVFGALFGQLFHDTTFELARNLKHLFIFSTLFLLTDEAPMNIREILLLSYTTTSLLAFLVPVNSGVKISGISGLALSLLFYMLLRGYFQKNKIYKLGVILCGLYLVLDYTLFIDIFRSSRLIFTTSAISTAVTINYLTSRNKY
eukprot:maker-scaffold_10-snap-gene-10.37-mRNA-1 protein AED:0.19 eAED:0.19 QI:87/1/0.5/1/1/1/2/0/857